MPNTIRYYPKHNGAEEDRGFTAEEIRRNIHLVYADVECECGKVNPMAAVYCVVCGESLS